MQKKKVAIIMVGFFVFIGLCVPAFAQAVCCKNSNGEIIEYGDPWINWESGHGYIDVAAFFRWVKDDDRFCKKPENCPEPLQYNKRTAGDDLWERMGEGLDIDFAGIMRWSMEPDTEAFKPGEGRQFGDKYFYIAKKGDTLSGIVRTKCKTFAQSKIRKIARENGIRNIHKIYPGTPIICKNRR